MSRSNISGILNINKPPGITSRQVVDGVLKVVRPAKAGHAGTLDPLATGVLVVCVGAATRLTSYVQQGRKVYRTTFVLGRRSDTDDVTGAVTEVADAPQPDIAAVTRALLRFVGEVDQVPPAFSAVHVDGRRAYKLAREGKDVNLSPRRVQIDRLDVLRYDYPELELEIECGSGTYVRSIGRDVGEVLGCGAVMSRLTRTRVGPYGIDSAVALDGLSGENLSDWLLPPLSAVAHLEQIQCGEEEWSSVSHGRAIPAARELRNGEEVVLLTPAGELAAIAIYDCTKRQFTSSKVLARS